MSLRLFAHHMPKEVLKIADLRLIDAERKAQSEKPWGGGLIFYEPKEHKFAFTTELLYGSALNH